VEPIQLEANDVRVLALQAQGLLRSSEAFVTPRSSLRRRATAVNQVLNNLGAVQLDTISVLARSHELVPYARLGPVGRLAVETAYWGGETGNDHPATATSFEYWSHAACLLPIEEWPLFAYRRRSYARRGIRWHEVPTAALDVVRKRLLADGPLTTTDLGGAKKGGEWWDWSDTKIAVEWLLDIGAVVCVRRVGWRRVYDLVERAVPAEFRQPHVGDAWVEDQGVWGPSDSDCVRALLMRSARVLGVGTLTDLVDVHRLIGSHINREIVRDQLANLVADGVLVSVQVEGWNKMSYCLRDSISAAEAGGSRLRSRTTLLSPFDSLVWDRARTSRVFGFDHSLEAYVPAAKRVHGYFTMPVLHAGRLVARVDPKREGEILRARQVTFEVGPRGAVPASAVTGTAKALREAATWVGCTSVGLGRVIPAALAPALHAALRWD
jgi:uncharacterized protein YcaQ